MKESENYRIKKKIDNPEHKELDPVDYGRLVGAWEWGGSFSEIGRQFGLTESTVRYIIKRYNETGSPLPTQRLGKRKKITDTQKNRIMTAIRRNPTETYTDQWKAMKEKGLDVCKETFVKCVKEMGFKQYAITEVPSLSPAQVKKRYSWCKERLNWTPQQWEEVVWSDESMFRLGKGAQGVNVIRFPGEGMQERHKIGVLKFGQGSIMMWGCFHAKALGPLVIMRGTIDQDKYVTLLSNYTIPWLKEQHDLYGTDFIYQEDGAPIHTGGYARWYKSKTVIRSFDFWPPNSPDLNPIEHIWGYLKLRVNRRAIGVSNLDQFESIIRDEWSKISNSYLEALVASMPDRCAAVFKAKGGNTRY